MKNALWIAFVAITPIILAGCAAPEDKSDDGDDLLPVRPPRAGVVYFGNNRSLLPYSDVLPSGLPLPVGVSRYSPFESFEPTLGVTKDGTLFLSTFQGGIGGYQLLARSKDKGVTWDEVTPQVGPSSWPPQSNDPYVHVDQTTDRVFLSDLQALVCSTLSYSDNKADAWTTNPVGCGHPFGVHDHQTVFTGKPRVLVPVGYANLVYYCINRVVDSACASSVNGGLSFGPLRPVVFPGVDPTMDGAFCGGLHGHGTTAPDGTVYLPKGHCGKAMVAVSTDDGLTWTPVVISEKVPSPDHEVAMATDVDNNAYAAWINYKDTTNPKGDDLLYLAASTNGGQSFHDAYIVTPPEVKHTLFPTIAAAGPGRVAISYYGTEAETVTRNNVTWNGYITMITGATGATPMITTVTVNDPSDPLARGTCGGRCSGVGDFIDIVIDEEGRPWTAFVDVCNEECGTPDGSGNSGAVGFVGSVSVGPKLRGAEGALMDIGNSTMPSA